jgi:hypothetical protein
MTLQRKLARKFVSITSRVKEIIRARKITMAYVTKCYKNQQCKNRRKKNFQPTKLVITFFSHQSHLISKKKKMYKQATFLFPIHPKQPHPPVKMNDKQHIRTFFFFYMVDRIILSLFILFPRSTSTSTTMTTAFRTCVTTF